MCKKIVVEEKPGLYVSEVFSNLRHRNKKPKLAKGQPPPPFDPAPLQEFLRVMGSSHPQGLEGKRIVVEERPGLYVSELFPNLHPRNKKPKLVEGQPPPPFDPAPLQEFLRAMASSHPPTSKVKREA